MEVYDQTRGVLIAFTSVYMNQSIQQRWHTSSYSIPIYVCIIISNSC